MKIKSNQVYWLHEGLKIGAQDHMLDACRTIAEAKCGLSIILQRDNKAFDMGYQLGFSPTYETLYRQDLDLLNYAVTSEAITPIDWKLYRTFDGKYHIE